MLPVARACMNRVAPFVSVVVVGCSGEAAPDSVPLELWEIDSAPTVVIGLTSETPDAA